MYSTYCDERLEYRFSIEDGVELSVCIYAKTGNISDAKSKALIDDILAGLAIDGTQGYKRGSAGGREGPRQSYYIKKNG